VWGGPNRGLKRRFPCLGRRGRPKQGYKKKKKVLTRGGGSVTTKKEKKNENQFCAGY